MKRFIVLLFVFIVNTSVFSQSFSDIDNEKSATKNYIGSLGVKFMVMDYDGDPFYVGELPSFSRMASIVNDDLFFYMDSNFTWGLTHFFFDYSLGAGLRYYPEVPVILHNNNFLSFYSGGQAGTFFFNNVTLLGRVGADLEVHVDSGSSIFLGGELFYRKVYELAGYIEKDYWYISSPGWSINGGFRAHFDFKQRSSGSGRTRTL